MKKSLVALAVLAASGAAMAQSSVTLYGWLDVLVGSKTLENNLNKTVPSLSQIQMDSGNVNGSRWGLKGSEDLGDGLKAVFNLQSGFALDTGAAQQSSLLFGRQAVVGFAGSFGQIVAGRVISPFYENEGMNDVMMNSSLSAQSNVMRTANNWGTAGNNGTLAGFESATNAAYVLRMDNAFRYDSPRVNGFAGSIAYSLDEKTQTVAAKNNGANGNVLSTILTYVGGPVSGILAYQNEKPYQPKGVGATGTDFAGTTATDRSYTRLSGQYDFGTIIAKAGFGHVSNVNFMSDASTNEYQAGLDYKLSAVALLSAGVASSKDAATASTIEVKRNAFTLGGKYTLSKRTYLYGGYEAGKQTKADAPDAKESILAFGVNTQF